MTEVARTQGSSAEIERGEVAEVAALGNVLKELFTRLGISQSQYAYRVHLDKSAVSRYLTGRRIAPQGFIDRLVQEVEDHLGTPLQLEARQALRARRLEALRVCDPDEFRLEGLRDELARSRRDTERAHRNIEALNALLDRKEAEARDVADDLTRLRLDWGAERTALAGAREDLLRQVERLREDLRDAEHLREEADRHGAELRATVLRLEEELSRRRPATGPEDVPLDVFKERIRWMWEQEDLPDAARSLTEAAWSRPLEDVAELLRWLRETGAAPETFAADVARLRPLEDVLAFSPEVTRLGRSRVREAWVSAVAARVSLRNAAVVHQGLRDAVTRSETEADRVLAEAVGRVRSNAEAVVLVSAALAGTAPPARLPRVAEKLARGSRLDLFGLRVATGLAQAGRFDVGALVIAAAAGHAPDREGDEIDDVRLGRCLREFGEAQIAALFDLVTWLDDTAVMTTFADRLARAQEQPLLERLITTLAEHGRLELLDLFDVHTSGRLKRAVRDVRASRGQ
ncbi:helix-turn-helix domain-containing protein [Streptomyces sp. NPDC056549]|uniref:helix-turn-helix domain-containing protein n=1 Tax=Streptomyces sp. NPDC056549 TaxID=3345864 RepID=UPI0036A36474